MRAGSLRSTVRFHCETYGRWKFGSGSSRLVCRRPPATFTPLQPPAVTLQAASADRLAVPGVNWKPQVGSEISKLPPFSVRLPPGALSTDEFGLLAQGLAIDVSRKPLGGWNRKFKPLWEKIDWKT